MEKTGYKIICGAPTTLALKGLMMMMKLGFFLVRNAARFPEEIPLRLDELQAWPLFPDVVFPFVSQSVLSSSPFYCALQDGFGQT